MEAMAVTLAQPAQQRQRAGMSRILELDGLRAVAILLVLGCHYPGFAERARRIPEFGWIGVDIFFALSGYLITAILLGLRGRTAPYRTFYSRRMIRILPPYLVTTLFLLVIAVKQRWLIGNFLASQLLFLQALPQHVRDFSGALLQHPKFQLTHLAPLKAFAHSLPLGPIGTRMEYGFAPSTYWSLSIEEYFYLLWAPIVLRCSRRAILWIACLTCALEMLLRWLDGSLYAYFSLLCRFDALLYGALLALLFDHWRKHGIPQWASRFFFSIALLACVGVAAILFAIRPVLGREIRVSPLLLVFGLPMFSAAVTALIGLLILQAGRNHWLARIFRNPVFVFIGTISYTMYLVHIIAGTMVLNGVTAAGWEWSHTSLAVASTLLTILIAYASWHWLEKPLLRWKDRHFPNAPHPSEPRIS
jgi:peptidoglycan/LPS O-acetylase OafA/YrhL